MQHSLIVQGTRGVLRADLFGMNVTIKRNTPLPKAVERLLNAINEGRSIQTQVFANAWRFARKRLLPYHGLQMLVAEFYDDLASGRPAPVTVADARPVVDWTERTARLADEAKQKYLQRFPASLTAPLLVTGATGFIGHCLLRRLLAEGQRVRILVRREPPADIMNDPRIEIVLGDLGDAVVVDRAVAGVSIVYHVGAAMSGAKEDFERGTVAGTQNILDSMRRHRVGKLVYVSSLSVLHAAAAKTGILMKEDWPLEPRAVERGAYTQTKLAAEQLVRQATDIPSVILRPGQVFGPGAPVLTGAVARRVGHKLVILGNGQLVLPLVYVEDVVDALLLAAAGNVRDGSVFHLVDSATITQEQLSNKFREATDKSLKIVHIPRLIVNFLALGVQLLTKALHRPAPLSLYRVKSALAPISFDCAAARVQLGWSPRVGAEKGLEIALRETPR
jgi:nucleoside-diphosphate-sugar epimerase